MPPAMESWMELGAEWAMTTRAVVDTV
jgi:hypothetical protein